MTRMGFEVIPISMTEAQKKTVLAGWMEPKDVKEFKQRKEGK